MKLTDAIEQYGRSLLDGDRQRFYALAEAAICAGHLTPVERDVIARVGQRQPHYWRRHLHDLRVLLVARRARQTGDV